MTELVEPTDKGIERAGHVLAGGGLVAFPTETVYGLGGAADNDEAVAGIYEAKGRPQFNPLIVHVLGLEEADRYALFTEMARKLAQAFWPGPLTMVLPRRRDCPLSLLVSAGLETVALRAPAHPIARALIAAAGHPIAAPSANASGTVSATGPDHVLKTLDGRIDMVLDGGACSVGLESTIVDVTGEVPVILRPGGITAEEISTVLGTEVHAHSARKKDETAPMAPGMLTSHYAPSLPVRLNASSPEAGEAYIAFGADAPSDTTANLSETGDLKQAASRLFSTLHALDRPDLYSGIAVASIPETGLGVAINDRLKRAAAPKTP